MGWWWFTGGLLVVESSVTLVESPPPEHAKTPELSAVNANSRMSEQNNVPMLAKEAIFFSNTSDDNNYFLSFKK